MSVPLWWSGSCGHRKAGSENNGQRGIWCTFNAIHEENKLKQSFKMPFLGSWGKKDSSQRNCSNSIHRRTKISSQRVIIKLWAGYQKVLNNQWILSLIILGKSSEIKFSFASASSNFYPNIGNIGNGDAYLKNIS